MALTFQPDTQKAFVVSGNADQDRFLREQAQKAVRAYENRLEFTFLTDLTIEELKEKVATLPPHSVVLYLSFFADKRAITSRDPKPFPYLRQLRTHPYMASRILTWAPAS